MVAMHAFKQMEDVAVPRRLGPCNETPQGELIHDCN
jgi:hypothetical protein